MFAVINININITTEQMLKEFWRESTIHITGRADFLMGKFNATCHLLYSRPIGMLVNTAWGNPDVRPTGNGARPHVGNVISSKVPHPVGIWTSI